MRVVSVPQAILNSAERDRYGGPGVVVWEGIILNGWTELHAFYSFCNRRSLLMLWKDGAIASSREHQLKQMLNEDWAFLPQELLDKLVLFTGRHCEITIAAKGGNRLPRGLRGVSDKKLHLFLAFRPKELKFDNFVSLLSRNPLKTGLAEIDCV
ncbi:hypothetical protein TNCV_610881 [Trichonephila clavipes]|nr:hypothetical protein TNCV_610881 [Trichonephila clavipes]